MQNNAFYARHFAKSLEQMMITRYTVGMNTIQRILLIIILSIFLIAVFATAIAFISGNANPGEGLRKEDPTPSLITKKSNNESAIFSQIGLLRCATGEEPSIPVIINPYFPYPADDRNFFEELAKKNQKIRLIIIDYIATLTHEELLHKGEQNVKTELINLINEQLVLGQIDVLYFSEYIFLE